MNDKIKKKDPCGPDMKQITNKVKNGLSLVNQI